jgi:hypothetical protein
MNFKKFILEKVYELSDKEEKEIDKLVKKYKNTFFKDSKTKIEILKKTPKEYFKDKLNEDEQYKLGNITVKDLEKNKDTKIKILVDFTKGYTNRGEYLEEDKTIFLYYYPLGFIESKIKDVITHEILHAKQQYKKMSKKYKKAITKRKLPSGEETFRSNRDYYMDPVEFPVYTTLIIKQLLFDYKELDKFEKIKFKEYVKNFIKNGAKLTVNNKTPETLLDKADFFNFIRRNRNNKKYREYYKSFLKKLYWLYEKLV